MSGFFIDSYEGLFIMKLFLAVIVCCATGLSSANQSFRYEKMHNFGIGRRAIPNYRRMGQKGYEYPNPLPSSTIPDTALVRDPFPNVYQGTRRKNMDVRVFKKDFDYPPTESGHKIKCESLVNCTISHLAIETKDGIPIILRGGVGYRHFTIIVKAKSGEPLKGKIKVYCHKTPETDLMSGAGEV